MPYAPAANTTSTISHLPAAYYKRRGQDKLKKKFRFMAGTEADDIPKRTGKTAQFFRYDLFPANTTPSSEGVVGSALTMTTSTITTTVEEYSDFVTLSKLLVDVTIDPIVEEAVDQLSYRAGLSVDSLVRIQFDAGTGVTLGMIGGSFTGADAFRAKAILEANDVSPRLDGDFLGIMHPFSEFDFLTDNTAGGWTEVNKYASPMKILEGEVGKYAGARWVVSTNVGTSGTAPNVLYNAYYVGFGGIGAVSLAGEGPSNVVDPDKQAFQTNVIPGKPQIADPEGKIGSAVSYYFVFATVALGTDDPRYRIIQTDPTLV